MPLSAFTPAVAQWFENAFKAPTEVQALAWPAIATGQHTLISAPTGSGKTLAAFLWGLDQFVREPSREVPGTRLVYVSPLKALAYDVDRNLRAPLRGIGADVNVAIRTGDTPQKERAQMKRTPPDILITTPESLYLILTSQARTMLEHVQSIIIDEIHAVAATKRGSHMALTLERLSALNTEREVQRIGLSATQNPLEEVGRYMVGPKRRCTIVDAGVRKPLDLKIHVPVESMTEPEQSTHNLDPLDPLDPSEPLDPASTVADWTSLSSTAPSEPHAAITSAESEAARIDGTRGTKRGTTIGAVLVAHRAVSREALSSWRRQGDALIRLSAAWGKSPES